MYKVFFKDRIVFLQKDSIPGSHNLQHLFYHYGNHAELHALISLYFGLEEVKTFTLVHEDLSFLWDEFKSLFVTIEAGGGLVWNKKGELLIIRRNGIWDLPKGKAEDGESIKETALREVQEECGIYHLSCKDLLLNTYHTYIQDDVKILKNTWWYTMKYTGTETPVPQTEENITEIRWVHPDKLSFLKDHTFLSILEVLKSAGLVV